MSESREHLLVRHLSSFVTLTEAEKGAIRRLPVQERLVPARTDIVTAGERPNQCCIVLTGMAFRYKLTSNGGRQILQFHVPGDIPDLQSLHLPVMDHHLAALTQSTIGTIPHEAVHDLTARFPQVASAFWRLNLADAALLRERIVSLGQRPALSRLAHFLCEMFVRLQWVGLTDGQTMRLPITQPELADALGLSYVHVNRMMQELRGQGLIETDRDVVALPDWPGLRTLAGFDSGYLHYTPNDRPRRI